MESKQYLQKIRVIGSGSNALLLTQSVQDVLEPKFIDISPFRFSSIHLGAIFALGIATTQQQLFVWGSFDKNLIHIPKSLSLKRVSKVSCGWQHALILTEQNNLYGLGSNKFQQINQNKQAYYSNPCLIIKNQSLKDIYSGFRQSYILTTNNIIRGRGQNKNYELSQRQKGDEGWIQMKKIDVKKMKAGKRFFVVQDINHNLWACGNNQFKIFPKLSQQIKQLTEIYSQIKDFSVGWNHIVLIHNDGQVRSYGRNNFGQLGHPQTQQILKLQNIKKIVSGTEFNFAIMDKKVYGWGWNQHNNISNQKLQIISQPKIILQETVQDIITYGASTFFVY